MKWIATGLLVLGGFICVSWWLCPLLESAVHKLRGRKDEAADQRREGEGHVSPVPVMGSLFVAISLFYFWQTTWILVLSIILILTDIGGLHWFAVSMFYHYVVKKGRSSEKGKRRDSE